MKDNIEDNDVVEDQVEVSDVAEVEMKKNYIVEEEMDDNNKIIMRKIKIRIIMGKLLP